VDSLAHAALAIRRGRLVRDPDGHGLVLAQ
jgi:hypothetical protein